MTNEERNKLLGSIEEELIEYLNWHKSEKITTEGFLRKEGSSHHLEYINAYEDGAISVLKDAIDLIRKNYKFTKIIKI